MYFLYIATAMTILSDRGTENITNESTDEYAGEKSYIYGKSTSNQVKFVVA